MKTYKKYITLVMASFILMSCSDEFLDKSPKDEAQSTDFYKTEEDAFTALVAVYDAFGIQNTEVSWAPFQPYADILSDDANAGGSDANDGKNAQEFNTYSLSTTSPVVEALYQKNYIGIYRANVLLERIEDIDVSEAFYNRTTAECKFARAYFYFELVRFYENIPLVTHTISGPSEFNKVQATPKEVYDQIALDLVEAIDGLPTVIPVEENGRVTKWAAESLLARVFLFYNGVYGADLVADTKTINKAAALAYLEDVITNSNHDLLPNYADIFRLASEFSVESVFEISFGDSPATGWEAIRSGEGNLAAQMQGPRIESGSAKWNRGWSFAPVTQDLVNAFDPADPRLDATILYQAELDGVLTKGFQHSGYFTQKYTSDKEHQGVDGALELNRTCNYRVIRFSDVLLMAAELGSSNAQVYLNRVRARVGLASVPVSLDNIYAERRVELAMEGIRYFDILRRGQAYAAQELTSIGLRGPNYLGDQVIFNVTYNDAARGFLPIPLAEISLSGGDIKQNDGY